MDRDYWVRQKPHEPLFPDLLWSRPESKQTAGKLLIVGGNAHGFAAPATAYMTALSTGIGTAHVVMPDALRKSVGAVLENCDFVPSTPSGGFASRSLAELIAHADWADAVLLAGELGRNAETAIVLEKFLNKHSGLMTITRDGIEYLHNTPGTVLLRRDTLLVLSISQLRKFATAARFEQAITLQMSLIQLAEALHVFTERFPLHIITLHSDHFLVASGGRISTTPVESTEPVKPGANDNDKVWRLATATKATVWWLQNTNRPFEAFTTSLLND